MLNVVYLIIIQSVNMQYARGCCILLYVFMYFAIRSYARIVLIAADNLKVLTFKLSADVYGQ